MHHTGTTSQEAFYLQHPQDHDKATQVAVLVKKNNYYWYRGKYTGDYTRIMGTIPSVKCDIMMSLTEPLPAGTLSNRTLWLQPPGALKCRLQRSIGHACIDG